MSLMDKMLALDQRIIFALMFLALAFPILNPVILPMDIQQYSRDSFEFADAVPNGSVVLIEGGLTAATYPQGGPGLEVQIVHLLRKDIKLVFFSIGTESSAWTVTAIDNALAKLPSGVAGENGVNWVHMGYVPGGESGVAAFANDIRSVKTEDHFGTPIGQIPLMSDINKASDFAALFWWGGSEGSIPYGVRQIVTPFGVPMTGMCTTNEVPNYTPYISSGQMVGIIGGVRGSAEYEYLMGMPGLALGQAMATNFGGLLWAILVVLGNVLYFIAGRGGGSK
ncbi:MAG TPA: hypothetical protein VGB32_00530 [Candidatus Bathyarchaeia archaeon]